MKLAPSRPIDEEFFQHICAEAARFCDLHPEIKNIHVMAILAQAAGYCIAMTYQDERDLARALTIRNLDDGIAYGLSLVDPASERPMGSRH